MISDLYGTHMAVNVGAAPPRKRGEDALLRMISPITSVAKEKPG
ncbi:hypothetical protein [Mesorhizobium sp.]|nr:hypothetical protein [Mesorhizobium sp.]